MVERDEVFDQFDHVHGVIENDDAAGTEHGLVGGHGLVVKGDILGFLGGQHRR